MNTKISVVRRIYHPDNIVDVDLYDVLESIRSGSFQGQILCGITTTIQSLSDHSEQGKLKFWNLPAVLFNGTFSYKNNDGLTSYSSFTALDFDQFQDGDTMERTKLELQSVPYVVAVFVTPSGKGLKAIVWHDNKDPIYHDELYHQLLGLYQLPVTDSSVCDLSRGNYLCYDPSIWINPSPVPYHFVHDVAYAVHVRVKPKYREAGSVGDIKLLRLMLSFRTPVGKKSDSSIINILNAAWKKKPDYWREGNRANSVFSMSSQMCNAGINIDKAIDYLVRSFSAVGLNEDEIVYQTYRGYQNNADEYGSTRCKFDSYGSRGRK